MLLRCPAGSNCIFPDYGMFVKFAHNIRQLSKANHIENQRNSAIAQIVAPAKHRTDFNCLDSGFTTISSVSLISSTTNPNSRSPAWSTTMLIDSAAYFKAT